MGALRITLMVIFIVICIALVILVLMQEGKLVKITTGLAVAFMVLAVVLNLNLF